MLITSFLLMTFDSTISNKPEASGFGAPSQKLHFSIWNP